MSGLSDGGREYLLAFADDEHLIGQQHTEWIGTAPFLEEDLAFCSIAQDELGHAAALYELLGDADELAFRRARGVSVERSRRTSLRRVGRRPGPTLAVRPRRGSSMGGPGGLLRGGSA